MVLSMELHNVKIAIGKQKVIKMLKQQHLFTPRNINTELVGKLEIHLYMMEEKLKNNGGIVGWKEKIQEFTKQYGEYSCKS